jgi:hypothetical protein
MNMSTKDSRDKMKARRVELFSQRRNEILPQQQHTAGNAQQQQTAGNTQNHHEHEHENDHEHAARLADIRLAEAKVKLAEAELARLNIGLPTATRASRRPRPEASDPRHSLPVDTTPQSIALEAAVVQPPPPTLQLQHAQPTAPAQHSAAWQVASADARDPNTPAPLGPMAALEKKLAEITFTAPSRRFKSYTTYSPHRKYDMAPTPQHNEPPTPRYTEPPTAPAPKPLSTSTRIMTEEELKHVSTGALNLYGPNSRMYRSDYIEYWQTIGPHWSRDEIVGMFMRDQGWFHFCGSCSAYNDYEECNGEIPCNKCIEKGYFCYYAWCEFEEISDHSVCVHFETGSPECSGLHRTHTHAVAVALSIEKGVDGLQAGTEIMELHRHDIPVENYQYLWDRIHVPEVVDLAPPSKELLYSDTNPSGWLHPDEDVWIPLLHRRQERIGVPARDVAISVAAGRKNGRPKSLLDDASDFLNPGPASPETRNAPAYTRPRHDNADSGRGRSRRGRGNPHAPTTRDRVWGAASTEMTQRQEESTAVFGVRKEKTQKRGGKKKD